MVVVDSSTAPATKAAKQLNRCDALLVYLLIAVAVSTLLSVFGPTLYIVEQQHVNSVRGSGNPVDKGEQESHAPPRKIIEVSELAHEEDFRKTIKSCLPSENPNCGEYIPEPAGDRNNKKKVQRVALIAPPGNFADSLLNRVEDLAHQHNKRGSSNKQDLDIDVILTSHVPPYGYGKTHGLTKIIRLVPRPLLLEVTDALTNLLELGETYQIITLDDLRASLRMVLRLHCRLSHVAAHTSVASIPALDLLQEPAATLSKLHRFLAPRDAPREQHSNREDGDDDLEFDVDDDQAGMMESEAAYGTQILTYVQAKAKQDVMAALDRVLVRELEETSNFSKWPCPSFWSAGGGGGGNGEPEPLSALTQRLARELSPDCDDPYNSCFVNRDKCEFAGQAVCLDAKQQQNG